VSGLRGFRHDPVHSPVKLASRDPRHHLRGKAHADGRAGREPWQRAVVEAAALAQTPSATIEADPGHQENVKVAGAADSRVDGRLSQSAVSQIETIERA